MTFSLPDSVSKHAVVDKLSSLCEESVHDRSQEVAHPKINVLHLPQHISQLEARNTDEDNAKQQKRKIEDSSNCSQPLACAQVCTPGSNRRGKGQLSRPSTIAVLDQTNTNARFFKKGTSSEELLDFSFCFQHSCLFLFLAFYFCFIFPFLISSFSFFFFFSISFV